MAALQLVQIVLSLGLSSLAGLTIGQFIYFLSFRSSFSKICSGTTCIRYVEWDGLLLLIFMIQQFIMYRIQLEKHLSSKHLVRTVYRACTNAALLFLMYQWKPCSCCHLWSIQFKDYPFVSISIYAVQIFCWVVYIFTWIALDFWDATGLKHVLHSFGECVHPRGYLMHRFLQKARFTGFLPLVAIIWINSSMSADRCLLGLVVPLYFIWSYELDDIDLAFLRYQFMQQMW